jgi:hypothetical protein
MAQLQVLKKVTMNTKHLLHKKHLSCPSATKWHLNSMLLGKNSLTEMPRTLPL